MPFVQPGDEYDTDKDELTITMQVMTMPTRVKNNSGLIRYPIFILRKLFIELAPRFLFL